MLRKLCKLNWIICVYIKLHMRRDRMCYANFCFSYAETKLAIIRNYKKNENSYDEKKSKSRTRTIRLHYFGICIIFPFSIINIWKRAIKVHGIKFERRVYHLSQISDFSVEE